MTFRDDSGQTISSFKVDIPRQLKAGVLSGKEYPGEVFVLQDGRQLKKLWMVDDDGVLIPQPLLPEDIVVTMT